MVHLLIAIKIFILYIKFIICIGGKMKEYGSLKQGHLEGNCGMYALFNALYLLNNDGAMDFDIYEVYQRVIKKIDKYLISYTKILSDGMTYRHLYRALQYIVNEINTVKKGSYNIFLKKTGEELVGKRKETIINNMNDFLYKTDNRLIVLGVDGICNHWTCVRDVTDSNLLVADSSVFESGRIPIKKIKIIKASEDKQFYCIYPQNMLYLERVYIDK